MSRAFELRRGTDEPIMFSIAQVCVKLGIGRSTFYKLMTAGDIRAGKVAGQIRVHRDDLDAFINRVRGAA